MKIVIDKWSQKNLLVYTVKIWQIKCLAHIVQSWRKKSNYNPRKQMLRGVPWDKLFHNFKNIARDILSSKIFVKYLNTCQVVLCIYMMGYIHTHTHIYIYIYYYYIYKYIYVYIYINVYIYIWYVYIYNDVHQH